MKLAKSVVSVLLAVMLVFTVAISAFAVDATVSLTASSDKAAVGDTIVISVKFSAGDATMNSGKLPVVYDASLVEFVKVTDGEGLGMNIAEDATGMVKNAFAYTSNAGAAEGVVYTVEFKAIAEGVANFSIDSAAYLDGDSTYALTTSGCAVTIGEVSEEPWYMVADLNKDGKINLGKDLNFFWEAYWHMQEEEFGFNIGDTDIDDLCARADFNGDGKINLGKDLNYFWSCYWAYQDAQ